MRRPNDVTAIGSKWNSGITLERLVNGRKYKKRLRNWYLIDNQIGDFDCFTWGYHGTGPVYTAYSILRELFGRKVAVERYCDFVELFVSKVPEDSQLRIDGGEICRMLNLRIGRR